MQYQKARLEESFNVAFDYKSNDTIQSSPTVIDSAMLENNSSGTNSYSAVAKCIPKPVFLKRDQAILIHSEPNLVLFDYVKAIDYLIENHPADKANSPVLAIRRLVILAKRALISNVSPSIPHELVEKALRDYGLQLASLVSFLKVGILGDDYSHIIGFRRQVFVIPQSENPVIIPHDNNSFRIFLSFDKMEFFLCKSIGHVEKICPNKVDKSATEEDVPFL
ncbi:unnamed protein product [Psylliodes chrysocephalus]|uniref:Uncharacterized protein n=1 Tax=Psylliodes chrysocephalus TaxID=3402493 RepID=A0A9P0CP59_9CUCU|nr:unnamed protein product [Psylliodes chrysocephala]